MKLAKSVMSINITLHTGSHARPFIAQVSKFRIEAFKHYPYLYHGSKTYEENYLQHYAQDKRGMVAIASLHQNTIGISTGIPLSSDADIISAAYPAFKERNLSIDEYYYYGEVIIKESFQRQGIMTQLYAQQDQFIQQQWGYKKVCILTVVRERDHPLRPINYSSPDSSWKRLGFSRTGVFVHFHWPTIQPDGSVKNAENTLEFWIKSLHDD